MFGAMFSKTNFEYESIHHQVNEPIAQPTTKKVRRTVYLSPKFILFSLTFTSIIATTIVLYSQLPQQPFWTSCGNTSKSARARGCSFDLISFAWQTPECYDSSLVSEFITWDNWTFSTELHGNQTIPLETALQGEQSLFVTWHYHMVHCTFMWRQMHRAFENGWIDIHLRAYNHTLHCQKMLLETRFTDDIVNTNATVIYPACERVRKPSGSTRWSFGYSS